MAKIELATLRPASTSFSISESLWGANGSNNFSHGLMMITKKYKKLRRISKKKVSSVPYCKICKVPRFAFQRLKIGVLFPQGRANRLSLQQKNLFGDEKDPIYRFYVASRDVKKGTHILLDDGNLEFVVEKVDDDQVFCQVITGES